MLSTDQVRLLEKLCAPRMEAGPRQVGPSGGLGHLGGILDEIDETVMARQLVLTNSRGERLQMDVCNRRLLHLRSSGSERPELSMSAQDLTYAGASDLYDIRNELTEFSKSGSIAIELNRSAATPKLEDTGLSVAASRQAWTTREPEKPAEPVSLLDLCNAMSGRVRAWLLDDPSEPEAQGVGEEEDLERLVTVLEGLNPEAIATDCDSGAVLLTTEDTALLIARSQETLALLLMDRDVLSTAITKLPL